MADTFGAITLPVAVPSEGTPVADPALQYIGEFLKAVLEASLGDAWATRSRDPLVRSVFTHDPEEADVSQVDFPSLYVWRSRMSENKLSDDHVEVQSQVSILWIKQSEPQAVEAEQAPIFAGFAKAIMVGLRKGRDPAWVVAGDSDATATTRGSLLWKYVGGYRHRVTAVDKHPVQIEMYEGAKLDTATGILATLEFFEAHTEDPALYASGMVGPSKMTTTFNTPGESPRTLLTIQNP